jgi:hypothetical protein
MPRRPRAGGKRQRAASAPLYGLLFSWAPGDDARRKILVDNPTQLYGF